MYPAFVDMNEIESSKSLRMLELDAYSNMLAALRAQGPPTVDKMKLLKDVALTLHIPQERCKAEIRKVVLDEKLNTIAYYTCGQVETTEEWVKEGRRLITLIPRSAAETVYTTIANEVADTASLHNEQLPLPAHTERKRSISSAQGAPFNNIAESSKSHQFKVPECLKNDDSKKRKIALSTETSALAQHLLNSVKCGKIQQLYRQKNKSKTKDHHLLLSSKQKTQDQDQQPKGLSYQTKTLPSPITSTSTSNTNSKVNILQNISVVPDINEEEVEETSLEINSEERICESPQPGCSNDNQTTNPLKQTLVNIKANNSITYKHVASPGPSCELPKSVKICTRKQVTKNLPGQKLVIVSNAQSINNPSILQRTLTIPFKNISVQNIDKFKIVTTCTNPSNLQITSLANSIANTSKHKVVTVKSNSTTKKVIPLAHLQALNAKGSLKMFPIGTKFLSKTTASSMLADVTSNVDSITITTTSTPVIMSSEQQHSLHSEPVDITENGEVHTFDEPDSTIIKSTTFEDESEKVRPSIADDIESQITQLTAIPQTLPDKILADEHVNEVLEEDRSRVHTEETSADHNSVDSSSVCGSYILNEEANSAAALSYVNSNGTNITIDSTSDQIVLNEECTIEDNITPNLID